MKKDVIKRREMIHIPHSGTLIQSQLWNILIAEAWLEIKNDTERVHTMTAETLKQYLSYNTNNYEIFREAIEGLSNIKVTFKIIGEKGDGWGFYHLLAEGRFVDGEFRYEFPSTLREQMRNDENYYAKISLVIQQKFKSKFSLALYEICFDNRNNKFSKLYTLDEMRYFFGIDGKYKDWRDLKRVVFDVAVKEINSVSDITVDYKTKKTGRKTTHIQFLVTQKRKLVDDLPKVKEEEKPVDYLFSLGLVLGISSDNSPWINPGASWFNVHS